MTAWPPLNALKAFEAAARLRSLKRAAAELGVSQPAISRQVAILESWLGLPLFRRYNRQIVLTKEGSMLLEGISQPLHQIVDATAALREQKDEVGLAIDVPPTFALRWLMRRIPGFLRVHTDVDIRLSTSIAMPFSNANRFDVVVRRSRECPEPGAIELLKERMLPVCSPSLLEAGPLTDPSDLKSFVLIHSSAAPDAWPEWFEGLGCEREQPGKTLSFETMNYAIEAARNGLGVAIIPAALVIDQVVSGELVVPYNATSTARGSYWIFLNKERSRTRTETLFVKWLVAEAAETEAQIDALPRRSAPDVNASSTRKQEHGKA